MKNGKTDYHALWHTGSHILAQAVKDLFPEALLGTGPATAEGFYYDFFREKPFTPEDLAGIEARMREIIAADLPLERREVSRDSAREQLAAAGETFKLEILSELPDGTVSFYGHGDFWDLCSGPHVPSTGRARALALLSVAASHWRGDENRESMQRIYGVAFPDRKLLAAFLARRKEAGERDHRRLGVELDLFSFQEKVGPGLVFWHPAGACVRRLIEDFLIEQQRRRGYQLLCTPHLGDEELWRVSGHLDFYRDYMFPPMELENQRLRVKPMNCPGHILVYRSRRRSYRELPIRWAEFGTVYRLEKSGVMHGLLRVRGFTQDDAHIFCRPGDLADEVRETVSFALEMLRAFGFSEFDVFLSTRPEKFVGSPENWETATGALRSALETLGIDYTVDPGEGVFYGPKIDIKIRDALGRSWQCSTIQVDFNLPDRFNLTFQGPQGTAERPIMIHRALLGSLERFFGVLIEHYKGAFPFWLAPVQVAVLTITERENDYARVLFADLTAKGFRCIINDGSDTIARKVRAAQLEKIPVTAVTGGRERENGTVAVRLRGEARQQVMARGEFVAFLRGENNPGGGGESAEPGA